MPIQNLDARAVADHDRRQDGEVAEGGGPTPSSRATCWPRSRPTRRRWRSRAVDEGRLAKILVPAGTEGRPPSTPPIALLAGEGESPRRGPAAAPRAKRPRQPGRGARPAAPVAAQPAAPKAAQPPAEAGHRRDDAHDRGARRLRERHGPRRCGATPTRVSSWARKVAEYQGSLTRSARALLEEFGAKAGDRHARSPNTAFARPRQPALAFFGLASDRSSFMTFNFAMQADRPHHQLGGQDAVHCRAASSACPIVFRGPNGAAARGRGPAFAVLWPAGMPIAPASRFVAPYSAADAKGLLKAGDPRSPIRSSSWRTRSSTAHSFDVPTGCRLRAADRPGEDRAAGTAMSRSPAFSLQVDHALACGRDPEGRKASRPRSSTCAACAPLDNPPPFVDLSVKKDQFAWSAVEGRAGPSPASGAELAAQMMEAGVRLARRPPGRPAVGRRRTCRCPMPATWRRAGPCPHAGQIVEAAPPRSAYPLMMLARGRPFRPRPAKSGVPNCRSRS